MASQQPRPLWFRFPALGSRPIAPPPNPTPPPPPVAQPVPIRPPPPMPAITRPIIPTTPFIMGPVLPTQTQEPETPPSTAVPQPLPPVPPSSPVSKSAPDTAAPRSPIVAPRSPIVTAAPETTPGGSPTSKSTIKPSYTPDPLPAQVEPPPSSPVVPPAFQPTRPSVPAILLSPQSPPATSPIIALHATSPVPKTPIIALLSSSPKPASPKVKTKSPSSSMPTSPVSRHVASPAAISATSGLKAATPVSSPKTVKPSARTPEQSPKINHLSHPPSPFSLPPAQKTEDESEPKFPAEVEQKTVLVQETIVKPKETTNSQNKRDDSSGRRDHVMKTRGTSKKNSDSEESGMKVITLAGENKGAIMELSPNQRKNRPPGNPQRMSKNKINYIESDLDQSSSESGDGKSNKDGKTRRGMEMQSLPTAVFLNSNVQGANNSILYNCNHRHNDPGVHLSLTKNSNGSLQDRRGKTIH